MSNNPFSHIDLRVRSFKESLPFYRALLPAVGFNDVVYDEDATWKGFYAPGKRPELAYFGFYEDPRHQPNGNRIAFWVADRATVDRVATLISEHGALQMEGPGVHDEYDDDYYAVFFEDPSGNRFEVVYRPE